MLSMRKRSRNWLVLLPLLLALAAGGAFVSSKSTLADHKSGHSPPGQGNGDDGGGSTAAYTLTDLAGTYSRAYAISDFNGDQTAYVTGDRGNFCVAWEVTPSGDVVSVASVPLLDGLAENTGTDVNPAGVVVGRGLRSEGNNEWPAFVSVPGQPVGELPTFSGERKGEAAAINDDGWIVGWAHDENPVDGVGSASSGALWNVDTGSGEISGPLNLDGFDPRDVNNAGVMAGGYHGEAAIGWLDENAELQTMQLGVLPGDVRSEARAINSYGEVVGLSYDVDGFGGSFLWTPDDGMIDLPGQACDINDAGEIVGDYWTQQGTFAYLWVNGNLIDLNDLIDAQHVQLMNCGGINNSGQIVGIARFGKRQDSEIRAFLLTPTVR